MFLVGDDLGIFVFFEFEVECESVKCVFEVDFCYFGGVVFDCCGYGGGVYVDVFEYVYFVCLVEELSYVGFVYVLV